MDCCRQCLKLRWAQASPLLLADGTARTYIHTSIHPYIHTSTHPSIHPYLYFQPHLSSLPSPHHQQETTLITANLIDCLLLTHISSRKTSHPSTNPFTTTTRVLTQKEHPNPPQREHLMATAQPGTILASMDPNQRPTRRQRPTAAAPSPLKKQSDYHLVAPLKTTTTKSIPPASSGAASTRPQPAGAPKTPKQTSKERKKKFLCATPPTVLQDTRGKTEYGRGRQLGEGGFARCFLVQNKEGGLFAAKTVAKKSLQSQKMRAKVC